MLRVRRARSALLVRRRFGIGASFKPPSADCAIFVLCCDMSHARVCSCEGCPRCFHESCSSIEVKDDEAFFCDSCRPLPVSPPHRVFQMSDVPTGIVEVGRHTAFIKPQDPSPLKGARLLMPLMILTLRLPTRVVLARFCGRRGSHPKHGTFKSRYAAPAFFLLCVSAWAA